MMIIEIDAVGPFGDKRRLRIETTAQTIEVHNLLAKEGDTLCVKRPLYGYEWHMMQEIERLTAANQKLQAEIVRLGGA